jgi:hypothetical protein
VTYTCFHLHSIWAYISWTLRIFLVHASQLDWWEEVHCKLLALNDFIFGSLVFVKLNQDFGHGQGQNGRRFRSVLMATYSNHSISGFAIFFYGRCIWCSNVTPTPWKLFKGTQYNHDLLGVNLIVWYLSYCVSTRFLFSTNTKTCFSKWLQDVFKWCQYGNKKLVWNLWMKNIFKQLDTSSNELVMIFFR